MARGERRVNRVAQALRAAGVGAGDRVLWLGQNSFRLQELLLACCKLGAMFCPANWRQRPSELAFVIDDLAPHVVVWQHEEVGETVQAGAGRRNRHSCAVDLPRHRRVRGLARCDTAAMRPTPTPTPVMRFLSC